MPSNSRARRAPSLLHGLHGNEAHGRLAGRDGDGLRIGTIVLAALAEGHHELGGDEPGGMAARGKPPTLVMRGTAGFHRHRARWQRLGPADECLASEHASFYHRSLYIEHTDGEYIFCEINTDRSKLIHDFPSHCSD